MNYMRMTGVGIAPCVIAEKMTKKGTKMMSPGMRVKIARRYRDKSTTVGRMRFTVTKVFSDLIYMRGEDGLTYYVSPNHVVVVGS